MKRIAMLVAMLLTNQAHALNAVVANVSLVESTYMPGNVAFILTNGTALCPSGRWLFWQRDPENNKAVYAMLMSAAVSGRKINIFFEEGDSNCVPKHLHLVG
jgi:hypothetical protein